MVEHWRAKYSPRTQREKKRTRVLDPGKKKKNAEKDNIDYRVAVQIMPYQKVWVQFSVTTAVTNRRAGIQVQGHLWSVLVSSISSQFSNWHQRSLRDVCQISGFEGQQALLFVCVQHI